MEGESHHGARNGETAADSRLRERSLNWIDSLRASIRRANSDSLGQMLSSHARRMGRIDKIKATEMAARDLISLNKSGEAMANIEIKKYAQRDCQVVRK